ncbi:MAG TPA: hypothetical protein PKD99_15330 [Sphingopyxis sp.]|nr:hypothetical protein [Sphingopyxis sp.]HMP46469.1 hypothetical protein [Sphingopyxis sp.]HMQ18059.1 hypothetical protein [Sphingopyxis sp.]
MVTKANMGRFAVLAAIGLCAAMPAPALAGDYLSDMLSGKSAVKGKKLKKAIEQADTHPLGSEANPVRAAMPPGQRAYLSRLRCADGQKPEFERMGSMGIGPFGNIVDGYSVRCEGSEPASATVYMDMYHAGYVELRAVPGFTIETP